MSRNMGRNDTVLGCAFDLKPVPPKRRQQRSIYCSAYCQRSARNWRRQQRAQKPVTR